MSIQYILDAIEKACRGTRSDYHLTLAQLISALEQTSQNDEVVFDDSATGPISPHSYRGFYSDLAFERGKPPIVPEFLNTCRGALGGTFVGYKGGDFVMDPSTPLWCSPYGVSADIAIVGVISRPGNVVLITKRLSR